MAQTIIEQLKQIETEIHGVIVSQDDAVHELLVALIAKGHVLLEGVPGLAKTLLAKSLAQTVEASFKRVQFTPDLLPSDITGTKVYNMKEQTFEIQKGPIFTNILLADEINRTPAKTQAGLLEAMTESKVSIAGEPIHLPNPYMVIATQNPLEFDGTYNLPEALVDRFLMKIVMTYPTMADEVAILKRHHTGVLDVHNTVAVITKAITLEQLEAIQTAAAAVTVTDPLFTYICNIVRATRDHEAVDLGISPRGAIALLNASKAEAFLQGRDFIQPEDVKRMAMPTLRHRIGLKAEFEIEGVRGDDVILDLLRSIEVPR